MNFKPNRRVGARLQFRIENPGIYLIRLETLNTDSDRRGSELTLILAARFRA